MTRLLLLSALPTELRVDDIKKSDITSEKESGYHGWKQCENQLEFHFKEIK